MRRSLFVATCSMFVFFAALSPAHSQGRSPTAASESPTVSIDNFTFDAATLTVTAGTEVTWVNHDDVPHKVVSTEKKFSSPVLDTDGRFAFRFTTPGTYEYFCSIHPTMKGKVIVR